MVGLKKFRIVERDKALSIREVFECVRRRLSFYQHFVTLAKANAASLEWWEVPDRFRRPLLDQTECEKIDSGGAGVIWK